MYNPEKGRWVELGALDVLQVIFEKQFLLLLLLVDQVSLLKSPNNGDFE